MKKRNKPENKMLIQGEHTSEYVRTLNLISGIWQCVGPRQKLLI